MFGYTAERRQERADIADYRSLLREVMAELNQHNYDTALALAEFTTAAQNDTVGDDSPAEAGSFAGASLYVRERANESNPELEVEAFLKFEISDKLQINRHNIIEINN